MGTACLADGFIGEALFIWAPKCAIIGSVFTSPIGLLALLGVPAVIVLHLFRRRFKPQEVSALFLWAPLDHTSLSGRKRERLRTSASFWLEVLAALLAGLAFAGPRACSETTSQHLVCVLDDSASMAAQTPDGSLRDNAFALIEERIQDLPANSRVTLILTGTPPRMLAGPSAFPEEAMARLASYAPSAPSHSILPSLALAERIAADGSVWLITDAHDSDSLPPGVKVTAIGSPVANLSIVAASRIPITDPTRPKIAQRVLITVQSFALGTVASHISIHAGGTQLATSNLELAPGQRTYLTFDLARGVGIVEARLPADGLALDNIATLAPPPPRTIAIYSNLSSETSVRLGLASGRGDSKLDNLLRLVPASVEAPNATTAHLLFNESAATPAGSATTWSLTLATGTSEERQDLIGPFLVERSHPLFRGVTLDGIIWSRNPTAQVPGGPLVSAGNETLFGENVQPTRRLFFANFDPSRSSLQRSPDWPILLSNLVEMRRTALPGARSTSLASGEDFVWLGSGDAEYLVEGEGLHLERKSKGTLIVSEALPPGLYTLSSDDKKLCDFGVTFADAAESDLRELSNGEQVVETGLASIDSGTPAIQLALLAAMLALLLGDWFVLSRSGNLEGAA